MRISTATLFLPIIALGFSLGDPMKIQGQNVYQDYRVNPTGPYSPQDPWQKGRIFRTHTGHDGLFYNCDGEEEKRCSPWIRWGHRPCDDLLSPSRIRGEYKQSVCNALERLKQGSCHENCGAVPGMGYPPGAGYGNEPIQNRSSEPFLEPAPSDLGVPQVDDPNNAPPEPQPAPETGQRSRRQNSTPIVNLPSINHLRQVPR